MNIATNRKGREGQAIIMVTLGITFLIGILGLVVDIGWGYYRKQVAQASVDAVVTAAVVAAGTGTIDCSSGGVLCLSSPTPCTDTSITAGSNLYAGCQYAPQNGTGIPKANVMISAGTSPFTGVTTKYWVTATASETLLPTFIRAMGFNSNAAVAATATGAVIGNGTPGGGCLYIMDPTAGQSLMVSGASISSTCGIYLNSNNNSNAFTIQGAGTLTTGTAPFAMVTGSKINASGSGCSASTYYWNSTGGTTCKDPTLGTAAADPLASIPAPSYSGCYKTNYSWSNLTPPQTLDPGVYCGGINIGGGNVTLNPGTYILNGGGLRIQGGSNTTVTANGVFFYNTNSGNTAGSLLISSQVNATIKAPTSGTYQGLFFMQDHNVCPSTSHAINGAPTPNSIKINGTIYAHCTQTGGSYVPQTMTFTGQSTAGYYTAMIVDKLTVNGATNLVLDPTGGSNTGIGLNGNKPFLIQ